MHKLISLSALLLPLSVFSQQKPLDAASINRIKEGISVSARNTITIVCDFTQEKELTILNERILSTGKFYFKKERQLRWEYAHPFKYSVAIRGEEITILEDGILRKFNTQSNRIFAEVNSILIGSVRGTLLDDPGFKAAYFQNNGQFIIRLSPLSLLLQESLKEIVVYLNKHDFTADKLEMIEPGGDYTRIIFSSKQINEPLTDEIFILR